jgi:hypothetical protein
VKILAKFAGGSHAYGLNTPNSDYDERFVFVNEDIESIIGLGKNEFVDRRNDTEDCFGFELRHYMYNLKKTNTQAIEILFLNSRYFKEVHPFFITKIQNNKHRLLDPEYFYRSLKGYIFGERRLANGERPGKLGGKRTEQLEKYGFSPKNFVQLFRIATCGREFFLTGNFPVNIRDHDAKFADWLLDLKTNPEKFNKDVLNKDVDGYEKMLDFSYEQAKKNGFKTMFDPTLANEILFDFYYPLLTKKFAEKIQL